MATTANRNNTALKEAMTIKRHIKRCAVATCTLPGLRKIKPVRASP